MKSYDIVLVLGYFRSATAFLSIIRHLASEMSIGILPTGADASLRSKTGDTHLTFMRLCQKFGAEVLSIDEPVRARLMVVQQFPYPEKLARCVNESVQAIQRIGLMTLATAGLEKHDKFLSQFNIRKVYVPSKRFLHFLLQHRQADTRYAGIEVEEVGLPFARYPVFPEFKADWLIVAPTLFSFRSETGKQAFLNTMLNLLDQIPEEDVVVYKPHNAMAGDYFAPKFHYVLARLLQRLPGANRLLHCLTYVFSGRIRKHVKLIQTGMLHLRLLRRAIPLSALTPYAGISLEAYLPGVRKGVFGGLSNTIWGTLYFGLPFYNCVDQKLCRGPNELLNKNSDPLLGLNLKYFGVPYCEGDLGKGAYGREIVSDADRGGDLIGSILQAFEKQHA